MGVFEEVEDVLGGLSLGGLFGGRDVGGLDGVGREGFVFVCWKGIVGKWIEIGGGC